MAKFTTNGKVQCFTNWMMLWLDEDLIKYYRALCPKYLNINPPRTPAHISIVRIFEFPNKAKWHDYQGISIEIIYENIVYSDGIYFWLDAYSDEISSIRKSLGLPAFLGDFTCQHITIGNIKNA